MGSTDGRERKVCVVIWWSPWREWGSSVPGAPGCSGVVEDGPGDVLEKFIRGKLKREEEGRRKIHWRDFV